MLETQKWPSLGESKTSPSSPQRKARPPKEGDLHGTSPAAAPALLAPPTGSAQADTLTAQASGGAAAGARVQDQPTGAASGGRKKKGKKGTAFTAFATNAGPCWLRGLTELGHGVVAGQAR